MVRKPTTQACVRRVCRMAWRGSSEPVRRTRTRIRSHTHHCGAAAGEGALSEAPAREVGREGQAPQPIHQEDPPARAEAAAAVASSRGPQRSHRSPSDDRWRPVWVGGWMQRAASQRSVRGRRRRSRRQAGHTRIGEHGRVWVCVEARSRSPLTDDAGATSACMHWARTDASFPSPSTHTWTQIAHAENPQPGAPGGRVGRDHGGRLRPFPLLRRPSVRLRDGKGSDLMDSLLGQRSQPADSILIHRRVGGLRMMADLSRRCVRCPPSVKSR